MLTRMIQSSISISLERGDPLLIVERPKVGQHVSDKDNIGVAITAYDRKNKKDRYYVNLFNRQGTRTIFRSVTLEELNLHYFPVIKASEAVNWVVQESVRVNGESTLVVKDWNMPTSASGAQRALNNLKMDVVMPGSKLVEQVSLNAFLDSLSVDHIDDMIMQKLKPPPPPPAIRAPPSEASMMTVCDISGAGFESLRKVAGIIFPFISPNAMPFYNINLIGSEIFTDIDDGFRQLTSEKVKSKPAQLVFAQVLSSMCDRHLDVDRICSTVDHVVTEEMEHSLLKMRELKLYVCHVGSPARVVNCTPELGNAHAHASPPAGLRPTRTLKRSIISGLK